MHSNIDSVTSGQVRIKCHLCAKHMKNITYLFAISITNINISSAYNLAYLTPQDIFSWVPKFLLGPPKCKTKLSKKYSLCEKFMVSMQPAV